MAEFPMPPDWVISKLRSGLVIPAHPLALTADGKFDPRRQRALTRYYYAAGAGGVAVGVHTTQFEIRDSQYGLFKPVLELASETISECEAGTPSVARIAGVCGKTPQAVSEAIIARESGYPVGLISLGALKDASDERLLDHCRSVAEEIALFGFYLQPSVGGRVLGYSFWRRFCEIPNVVGIKIAPFNRYQTLDVVRALAEAGRTDSIALYTGNDDSIVSDLLTQYSIQTTHGKVSLRIVGGLLGHWACWTRQAVAVLEECKATWNQIALPAALLTRAAEITDCNSAFFDAANGFAGCIPGIHEILRRQGLLSTVRCLDRNQQLSPGQLTEIDRVCEAYPHLNDNDFVKRNLDKWLS